MVDTNNKITFEKRVYTVEDIMNMVGIGKNTAYELVKSGAFHFVKVGGHFRIPKKAFDEWLEGVGGDF